LKLFIALIVSAAQAFAGDAAEYHIGPGDVIDIKVHGQDFGRTNFVVGASGEVSFPYVGKVKLGEQTAFEAESTLEAELADGYLVEPQVTIQIKQHKSQRVDVMGAVGKPGIYYLDGPTTVRELLALAGGAKMEKTNGQVSITRGEDKVQLSLDTLQGPDGSFEVQRGDVIDVGQGSVVYLTGEVAKAGALTYTDGITASQALIRVGGPTQLSRLAGSYVLRDGERISINLKRVLKGKDADVLLQPGDQLVVPESPL